MGCRVLLLRSNLFWVILFFVVLVCCAVFLFFMGQASGSFVFVYQDGLLIESFDLGAVREPFSFVVDSEFGFNVVAFEFGRVCVSEADCPDGLCVRQGWLRGGVFPIVCLPNRLVVRIVDGGTAVVDAVVG